MNVMMNYKKYVSRKIVIKKRKWKKDGFQDFTEDFTEDYIIWVFTWVTWNDYREWLLYCKDRKISFKWYRRLKLINLSLD